MYSAVFQGGPSSSWRCGPEDEAVRRVCWWWWWNLCSPPNQVPWWWGSLTTILISPIPACSLWKSLPISVDITQNKIFEMSLRHVFLWFMTRSTIWFIYILYILFEAMQMWKSRVENQAEMVEICSNWTSDQANFQYCNGFPIISVFTSNTAYNLPFLALSY